MAAKRRKKRASRRPVHRSLAFVKSAHAEIKRQLIGASDLETFLESAGRLSLAKRKILVDQALILMRDNYVHLPLKEAMHGVDPVQRLRLVKHQLEQSTTATMGDEYSFHREMLEIFNSVRDLHTNYLLPAPFARAFAFLPFDIEEFFDNGEAHYIASHFISGFSHPDFEPGVEITAWSGVPIRRAVEAIANRHAGSNPAARHSRGVQGLTKRPLRNALPPDEMWVIIGYTDLNGDHRELRQDWLTANVPTSSGDVNADALSSAATALGVDDELDNIRRIKALLYAPKMVAEERKRRKPRLTTRRAAPGQTVPSTMKTVFRARTVDTPDGTFGHVRIFTFSVDDPEAFVEEFIRLLGLLPREGLILDVRDNGGGHIWASEGLLQTMTPYEIEPEPTQFINTSLNGRICKRHKNNPTGQIDLTPWVASIREAVETGAAYSRGFPITPMEFANKWGQQYHGPVVLITNARCYSATDIFAAGFQDHEIGTIVGVDDNTGAGGANVFTHGLLQALLQLPAPAAADSPYTDLPSGAGLRVSIRRTLRVGTRSGTPVEDLGVKPDVRHFTTRDDLLFGNRDLLAVAGKILSRKPVRRLDAEVSRTPEGQLKVKIQNEGLDRVDLYVDDRPLESAEVDGGQDTVTIDALADAEWLDLAGFKKGEYVAARKIAL